ncbi:MAG: type II toxin-antitoxin system RelE/ParE family toxin [Erysipelotrichaceae bacterium]|nr:type II toxin-antitoxin system RelE/ParE family toxin [Erysipelotrichaceae bacterium]
MEEYKIQITNEALADMEAIYNHIAYVLQSPENALKQYNHIASAIMDLNYLPERYQFISKEFHIQRMLVNNYSVLYVIENTSVIILMVLYSASNITERLKRLKFY